MTITTAFPSPKRRKVRKHSGEPTKGVLKAARRSELRRARMSAALARATGPSQRIAAALDYLRAVIADHRTDRRQADAIASTVVAQLVVHADHLAKLNDSGRKS